MLLAGTESSTSMLQYAFLYLAKLPEVQERAYREIRDTIGDRMPKVSDKVSLILMCYLIFSDIKPYAE